MASVDEVWLVDLGEPFPAEPAHRRPALIVGPPDTFGVDVPFVIVCPLTTRWRGLSLHIEVEPSSATALSETSYVQCELIRSVNRQRLVRRLGEIDPITSHRVHDIISMLTSR